MGLDLDHRAETGRDSSGRSHRSGHSRRCASRGSASAKEATQGAGDAVSSGYVNCSCRDCFEVTIAGNDPDEPAALCSDCEEAGCEPGKECQAEGAYGGEERHIYGDLQG